MKSGVHKHESMAHRGRQGSRNVKEKQQRWIRNMRMRFFLVGLSRHQREPFCHQYKWKDLKVASAQCCFFRCRSCCALKLSATVMDSWAFIASFRRVTCIANAHTVIRSAWMHICLDLALANTLTHPVNGRMNERRNGKENACTCTHAHTNTWAKKQPPTRMNMCVICNAMHFKLRTWFIFISVMGNSCYKTRVAIERETREKREQAIHGNKKIEVAIYGSLVT